MPAVTHDMECLEIPVHTTKMQRLAETKADILNDICTSTSPAVLRARQLCGHSNYVLRSPTVPYCEDVVQPTAALLQLLVALATTILTEWATADKDWMLGPAGMVWLCDRPLPVGRRFHAEIVFFVPRRNAQ